MFGYPQLIEFQPLSNETVEEKLRRELAEEDPELRGLSIGHRNRSQPGGPGITRNSDGAHKEEPR